MAQRHSPRLILQSRSLPLWHTPKASPQKIDSLLIDTSFWVSLFWPEDFNHSQAQKKAQQVSGKYNLFVSDDILKETLTVISQRCGKTESRQAFTAISNQCQILPTDRDVFQNALTTFFYPKLQKDISVIDCETANIAKEKGMEFILTFDPHFKSLGLTPLP